MARVNFTGTELNSVKRNKKKKVAFIAIRSQNPVVGQIINIDLKGLTFSYFDGSYKTSNILRLEIFSEDGDFQLSQIACNIIQDIPVESEYPMTHVIMRQCVVRFEKLSKSQEFQLDHFIRNYT